MRAMPSTSRFVFTLVVSLAAVTGGLAARQNAAAPPAAAPNPFASMTTEAREAFLASAKIVRERPAPKGTTNTKRVTLTDGTITHDASFQSIEEAKPVFETPRGTELNFKDHWRFNLAAYRLDRVLELNMVPATVERRYGSKPGSFTWWVDDVLMDEGERYRQKKQLPNAGDWNQQMWITRMFDQLIGNVDRNLGNLLIDTSYNIWMIDHSRSFRLNKAPRSPENLSRIDRGVLDRLRQLDKPGLTKATKPYLDEEEIDALLSRRDAIVAHFEKGGSPVIFERRPR